MRASKRLKWLMVFVSAASLFGIWQMGAIQAYSVKQQLTLLLLAIAIYFWTLSKMPVSASSLLLVCLMLIFELVEEPEDAFNGFLSNALYFILVLSLISKALVEAGVDRVFVNLLLKVSKGGVGAILVGLPLLVMFLPILLPSAVARFRILEPIIEQINATFNLGKRSVFRKFSMYVIGILNQNSTMVVFTGGGFSVLGAQLLRDFGEVQISWIGWFVRIAPPLWIAMLLVSFGVWFYFNRTTEEEDVEQSIELEADQRLPPRFWWIMIPFIAMIISWILLDQDQVPLIIAPILLVAYYALPVNGLITNKLVREHDWENFLLLGASFSLGYIIEENGTAMVLASQLMSILPENAGDFWNMLFITGFIFFLRFLFVVPSTSMIVIFPIIISYAQILDLPVISLAFLIIMIIGGVTILPVHSPTTLIAFQTGAFSKKDQLIIGSYSSLVVCIIAFIWAYFIW